MKFSRRREPTQPRPRHTAEVLAHEEEDHAYFFDPEKEISPEVRAELLEEIRLDVANNNWPSYCHNASRFIDLFPGERDAPNIDGARGPIFEAMRACENNRKGIDDCITMASAYIQFFPDQRERLLHDESIMALVRK